MAPIASVNSAALTILQQIKYTASPENKSDNKNVTTGVSMLAISNGVDEASSKADIKTADDYWGVLRVNSTEMKVKLIEKLALEFGIDKDDFESISAFGGAVHARSEELKRLPDGSGIKILDEIADKLGLDELGISLDTLIDAIKEPGGTADDILNAALKEKANELNAENEQSAEILRTIGAVRVDENGIYSLLAR